MANSRWSFLYILLLNNMYFITSLTIIECQATDCNGQTLVCNDPSGCQINCHKCQNTIILCTNDITITCAIKCFTATNACTFAQIYSAAQDTTLKCEMDNICANTAIYFGDVYDYLPPTVQPTQSPSKWNAPTSATYHVDAPTSFTLEKANILCEGDIQSCTVEVRNTNAAADMNMTCNAPTASCQLNCANPTGCPNVRLNCVDYASCACNTNCNDVVTTYGTVTTTPTTNTPTTNQPSLNPTPAPTTNPTPAPTADPTPAPTNNPTSDPTNIPTILPTNIPTSLPTNIPTSLPTNIPTSLPTNIPTSLPTNIPTNIPTSVPSTLVPTTYIPTSSIPSTFTPTTLEPSTSLPSSTNPTTSRPTGMLSTTTQTDYTIIITSNVKELNENDIENIIKDSIDLHDITSTKNADGSITLLISVANNRNLDQDIIKEHIEEALVEEYGQQIDIDVEVKKTDDIDKATKQTQLEMLMDNTMVLILAMIAILLVFIVCVLMVFLCKKKKQNQDAMDVQRALSTSVKIETNTTQKTVQTGEGNTNTVGMTEMVHVEDINQTKLIGVTRDTMDGFKQSTSNFIGDMNDSDSEEDDQGLYENNNVNVSTPGNDIDINDKHALYSKGNDVVSAQVVQADNESESDDQQMDNMYTSTTNKQTKQ